MSIHTICRAVFPEGGLQEGLADLERAESGFTREAGVLDRHFFQCVQQPHLIWARTEWTRQADHDAAARSIMKVRDDDRVAAAYFRPGLYFEIFTLPVPEGTRRFAQGAAGFLVVSHALLDDRAREGWEEALTGRLAAFEAPEGLLAVSTFRNYRAKSEFVALFEWRDGDAYEAGRLLGARTVEEHLLVREGRSDLAAYDQFECRPLPIRAREA